MAEPDDARREQTFFADPALDRMMGFCFALSAEVYVLRDRLQRLEKALDERGVVSAEALESASTNHAASEAARADRERFTEGLMSAFLGRETSKNNP